MNREPAPNTWKVKSLDSESHSGLEPSSLPIRVPSALENLILKTLLCIKLSVINPHQSVLCILMSYVNY